MTEATPSKQTLRQTYLAARNALSDRPHRSQQILQRLWDWEPFLHAETILCYVAARSEVDTRPLLPELLTTGKRLIIPYCIDDQQLGLFHLTDLSETELGRFGILEPRAELRDSHALSPEVVDLAILPGVAFDASGNRLGHGKGYFDRLLAQLGPETKKCALAFECQIAAEIPTEAHDLPIDTLITEDRLIDCRRSP
ncbi:5-formyltetrahydrofolate cyclo-ligase [Blastopirellula sp. JC732]|uniref:5-formyltetrahydrofolate cyclo-ligase n=1 Tax=Blastopirellula sediminis TaxID=2894196 RepID=A0A9X1SJL5_9BACT|nr:5-formyltetrahydrofolate cyclo-ligase [Blastopirellula sediminis]MCC9609720.1 5-formyltetrahydrofolate cyclo-ligase [Blastopirellula sediminis]MCC9628964.1 5-formyltetrahydrofolate cyclo-ligase [Blastopirellula sediminis]